jgi:hypothetical protein
MRSGQRSWHKHKQQIILTFTLNDCTVRPHQIMGLNFIMILDKLGKNL